MSSPCRSRVGPRRRLRRALFAGEQPLDVYRLARALHETCATGPNCWRRRGCRSSSVAGWSANPALSDPRPRPNGKLWRNLLTTDGGGHHLLRATGCLLERNRGNYPIAVATRFDAPRDEQVTVTGCLATPYDVLGDEVMLPHAEPGDLIAIFARAPTASPPARRRGKAAPRRAKSSSRGRSPRRNRGRAAGR